MPTLLAPDISRTVNDDGPVCAEGIGISITVPSFLLINSGSGGMDIRRFTDTEGLTKFGKRCISSEKKIVLGNEMFGINIVLIVAQ